MNRFIQFAAVVFLVAAAAFWWFFLDARAPASAPDEFDLAAYRALTADDDGLPTELRVENVGQDEAPNYAVEAGGGFATFSLAYPAFQIVWPDSTIVIGGAVDAETAADIAQSKDASFHADNYAKLLAAISAADQVLITHEHLDHIMAIARHPDPDSFADRLELTAPQIAALPQFAPAGGLDQALQSLTPFALAGPKKIAPGVVMIPAAGHSPGSVVFYVRSASGKEYLLIGDIVWSMSNIDHLKTRPRILQYLFFKPHEDREAVLRQVRALHDLAETNPEVIIVPNHDGARLEALVAQGAVSMGFK